MYVVSDQNESAAMLKSRATKLGTFGDDTYYCLDGEAWRMTGNFVFRAEDDLESLAALRLCRQADFPGNRPCTGCNRPFAINPTVGAHRRGYCSDKCEEAKD